MVRSKITADPNAGYCTKQNDPRRYRHECCRLRRAGWDGFPAAVLAEYDDVLSRPRIRVKAWR